jgi:Na+/phosphate symporter
MNTNNLIIAIAVFAAVAALLVCCFWYIKKKIRNKIIDKGADIIAKATGKYLDEKTAGKVSRAASTAAETLKKGNAMKTAAKKGLEMARDAKKNNGEQEKKYAKDKS